MKRKVICVIMGGGRGTRLYPLTQERCKPAVPLAGKYRLVDIPISNCLNSGYNRIHILTQFNTASLHNHIQSSYQFDPFGGGFVDILSAEQTERGENWYQGTADAVRQNLHHYGANDEDLFLILSGDQLYRMPSSALADRIERELNAAELIHNFGNPIPSNSRYKLGCGYDITLDSGAAAPDFYGQWVLQALGLVAVDPTNNLYTERAETNTFGYPPFANVSRPDLLTAADRPVYGAINMFRDAVGNLQCGPIAAVLSKRFVGKSAIAWPVDTGNFGWPACAQQGNWSECFGCSGNADCVQSKPLGAPGAMMHLLLPYLSYYTCANPHSSGPPSCTPHNASYNLARLAIRLLSRSTYAPRGSDSGDSGAASHGGSNGPMVADRPLTLNYAENMFGYFEVNPVATIPMSRQGIEMMIGSFGLLWGTAQGSRLREWSAARGWPLAWAYNPRVAGLCMTGPQPPPAGCLHARTAIENMTEDAVAVRLLDPKVLAQVAEGHNCSNAPAAATFERIWETASNVTSNISLGFGARQTRLRALWRELLQGEAVVNAFGVEPLCKPRHLTPFLMAAPSGVLMLTRVRVSQTTGRAGAWTASACALRTLAVCVPSMRESERDCQRGGSRGRVANIPLSPPSWPRH